MRSFPSALNKGGNQLVATGKTSANEVVEGAIDTSSFSDTANMKSFNVNLNSTLKGIMMSDAHIDISKYESLIDSKYVKTDIENPFRMSSDVITAANRYRFIYKKPVNEYIRGEITYDANDEKHTERSVKYLLQANATPSMFNPKFMVQAIGMTENTPLLMTYKDTTRYVVPKLPTIENLVTDSHKKNSPLGYSRFRRADFMYCRDLGKIANNHLIVLRKFAHPVGDNIFALSTQKWENEKAPGWGDFSAEGDIGRLVTWFGNEENKLEDILRYEYKTEWRHVDAARKWIDSKEDSESRGLVGRIANSLYPNADYKQKMIDGYAGKHTVFNWIGLKYVQSDNADVDFQDYDHHKVYEPANTIRETHIYDGKLSFSQDITLVFSYKLRAYDNINPKAAFLDLLGNIMEVTYKRGRFWGGLNMFSGPAPNENGWAKATKQADYLKDIVKYMSEGNADAAKAAAGKLTEETAFVLGQLCQAAGPMFNAGIDMFAKLADIIKSRGKAIAQDFAEDTLGMPHDGDISSQVDKTLGKNQGNNQGGNNPSNGQSNANAEIVEHTKELVTDTINAGIDAASTIVGELKNVFPENSLSDAIMAFFENKLGRPAKYAYDSILSGADVGLWHLTIGNPYNPIMAFGNLILDQASVKHLGPLGIDDFPTELQVTVKLKHARPRDLNEIGRMYTKGVSKLYISPAGNNYNDYFSVLSEYENKLKTSAYRDEVDRISNEMMQKEYKTAVEENSYTGTYEDYINSNTSLRDRFIEKASQTVESRSEFLNSLWGYDKGVNELISSRNALIAETTGDPRTSSFKSSIEEIS